MNFGFATISTPMRRPKAGQQPKSYDCGRHGKLTLQQISAKAGISLNAARYRARIGVRGDAMVEGTQALRRRRVGSICRTPSAVIACRLATAYPNKAPTWREVLKAVPMSEEAAKRWSRAMHVARTA